MELDVVTINSRNVDEALRVLEGAAPLFPSGVWGTFRYLGDIERSYDGKLRLGEETHPFYYRKTLIKMLEGRKLKNNLFGVTKTAMCDIITYYDRRRKDFRSSGYIIHDFVTGRGIGAISLFNLEDSVSTIVAAHGLGHDRGLSHHTTDQIDCMNIALLRIYQEIKKPFCKRCENKLLKY